MFSIQNKASNPADFSEMTQCFDMQRKKQVILFIYKVDVRCLPQEIQRESLGNH